MESDDTGNDKSYRIRICKKCLSHKYLNESLSVNCQEL